MLPPLLEAYSDQYTGSTLGEYREMLVSADYVLVEVSILS